MEQIQAIMEAARETKCAGVIQASPGALRFYTNDRFLYSLDAAATEVVSGNSSGSAPDHGNAGDLQVGD